MTHGSFHLTRTSQAPVDLRIFITATGQGLSLAPQESTIVDASVIDAIEADASLREHFEWKPVVTTTAALPVRPTSARDEEKGA